MRNYKKFDIWQESMIIAKDVYELSSQLPIEEKYGLKSQICRAVISIPSNIAEGCSKSSEKEFKHFLEIAIGSSFELETQLILIKELGFAQEKSIEIIIEKIIKNQKMINSLIGKLKKANS
ncbi:MAG: four helix bundle protein [Calditrichaeota bacterium]|nr:four helix bundle protein [Calditrichota bacterium]